MISIGCAVRRGRTPARSIDAAVSGRLYSRDCNGLMINSEFFGAISSYRQFAPHEISNLLKQVGWPAFGLHERVKVLA